MYLIGRICKNLIDYKISTLYTDTEEVFMMKKFFSFIFCSFVAFVSLVPCAFANFPNDGEIIHLTLRSEPGLRLCAPGIHYESRACDHGICSWVNGEGILGCGDNYGRRGHWVAHIIKDAPPHTYVLDSYETHAFLPNFLRAFAGGYCMGTLVLDETVTTGRLCAWSKHDGHNQQWIFEPIDDSLMHFRLRNRQTGRYVTMNDIDRKCVGWRWVDIGDRNYKYQIWEKH